MAEKIENRQEKVTDKKDSNQQEKSFLSDSGENFALSLDELIKQMINHHIGFDALA